MSRRQLIDRLVDDALQASNNAQVSTFWALRDKINVARSKMNDFMSALDNSPYQDIKDEVRPLAEKFIETINQSYGSSINDKSRYNNSATRSYVILRNKLIELLHK